MNRLKLCDDCDEIEKREVDVKKLLVFFCMWSILLFYINSKWFWGVSFVYLCLQNLVASRLLARIMDSLESIIFKRIELHTIIPSIEFLWESRNFEIKRAKKLEAELKSLKEKLAA